MEGDFNFLEIMKKFQSEKVIKLFNAQGIIKDIEEVEYKIFKLSIKINNNNYQGIYIKSIEENDEFKINDIIEFQRLNIIKKKRNIYLYLSFYSKEKNEKMKDLIVNEEHDNTFDLSPQSIIKTISTNIKINYMSDIFIIKQQDKEYILVPILIEKKFIIDNHSNKTEFEDFMSNNKIKEGSLIFIENYILENDKILFNNLTLFNLVKLEYLNEYFQKNFNPDYKNNIIYYKMNSNYKKNFVLLKVIDIQNDYILTIDYFLNIFKISSKTQIIKNINNVYAIIFIKNFNLLIEDSLYKITLQKDSLVFIFENSFCDIFLNNLTVINFNFIDFIDTKKNYFFNQIKVGNFSFEISKKSDYLILIEKFNLENNFYPYNIQLVSENNKIIRFFQIILYIGLLNKVNCLVNYTNQYAYGYEYFYYNFSYDLPKFKTIKCNDNKYQIVNSDNFNSKIRKRFILLNYYDCEYTKLYENEYFKKQKHIINTYDINDYCEEKKETTITKVEECYGSLLLIFFYEKEKNVLLGTYNINDINNNIHKKKIYEPNQKYKIFYNYFKNITNNNLEKRKNYLESLEDFVGNSDINNLICNKYIDFSYINYESYIIIINIILFYCYNNIKYKNELIQEFKEKFNLLKNKEMPYKDKIRIIRFSLLKYCETCVENRGMHLYFVDELTETNSYRIAINYNIDMINNLEETSKLYIPLLQLDRYSLYNYNINSISYTLSLEPLIITKKHLLSTYDNFFFTCQEKEKNNNIIMAFQDKRDDVTTINEYAIFPDINVDSSKLCGNDYAVPISTQLLHEKNGHSKNEKKNNRKLSPLYFYKKKRL